MVRYIFIVVTFSVFHAGLNAQIVADTLPTAITYGSKHMDPKEGRMLFDSTALSIRSAGELSSVLQNNSALHIKQYGPAGSSSVSVRGAGSGHTQVLWNGMNINSTSLGMSDLSLLPVATIGSVAINTGLENPSVYTGLGGGVVELGSKKPTSGIAADFTTGSFGLKSIALSGGYAWKHYSVEVKGYTKSQENNYPVKHYYSESAKAFIELKEPDTLNHSAFQSRGVMLQQRYKKGSLEIKSSTWLSDVERQVQTGNGEQFDDSFNQSFQGNYTTGKTTTAIVLGYNNAKLRYSDTSASIESNLRTENLQFRLSNQWRLNNSFEVNLSIDGVEEMAKSSSYSEVKKRFQGGVNTSVSYRYKRFELAPFMRINAGASAVNPLLPGARANFKVAKAILAGITYRAVGKIPTFNQLYYGNLGNPNLKPEKGTAGEATLTWCYNKGHIKGAAFLSDISEQIVWLPGTDGIYRPINIFNVKTRGTSVELEHLISISDRVFVKPSVNYTYNSSVQVTNTAFSTMADMLYAPRHQANANVYVNYKNWMLWTRWFYQGLRYTNRENTQELPGFTTFDLGLNYHLEIKKLDIDLNVSGTNLTGVPYQLVKGYPMPLQQFNVGVKINLKPSENEK